MHAVRMVLSKEIGTDATCSAARVFKEPPVVNWKDTGGTIPRDRNTYVMPPRENNPFRIGTGPFVYPTRLESQDIGCPRRSIGPQEVRNAEPLDTSMNGISSEHRDPVPTWIKVIGIKFSKNLAPMSTCSVG